jgi:hypothetical protein
MRSAGLLLFMVSLFFTSCKKDAAVLKESLPDISGLEVSNVTAIPDEIIQIDIEVKPEKALPFDSLLDVVSFIRLETLPENLLGNIDQILFTKDRMIIFDKFVSKSVSIYDFKGKFICKISNPGQGPEEYSYLSNIILTPDSSHVVLVDMGSQKLKYFSIDGKFIKSETLPYFFGEVQFTSENTIIGYSSTSNFVKTDDSMSKPTFILSDMEGHIFYSGYPSFYKEGFTLRTNMPIRKFGDEVYFNPQFNDTVFQVKNNTIRARYHLNFPGYKPIIIDDNTTDVSLDNLLKNRPRFAGEFIRLKDAFYIRVMSPIGSPFLIYSDKRKKAFLCNGLHSHPYFEFLIQTPIATRYGDNILVLAEEPSDILLLKSTLYRLGKDKYESSLDTLFYNLKEDDNQVLFFYNVKI